MIKPTPAKLSFTGNNLDIFVCLDCGKQTTRQEAELRNFSRGHCAFCNGTIEPLANVQIAEDQLMEARKRYRKLVGRAPNRVSGRRR